MSLALLPVSAVIATRHRVGPLARTLAGVGGQSVKLRELIVVDASEDGDTRTVCESHQNREAADGDGLRYFPATTRGAASQRNEGVTRATQPFILFLDDDILPKPDCLARLWAAISGDEHLGGVNATITNQGFHPPGRSSRLLFWLLDKHRATVASYAGRVLGPGLNLLPEDRDDLPEVVPVDWLNTTCTLYRREALPGPPFPPRFTDYSLMEDLTLSLNVAKRGWKLANARTARIFHDSQPGDHKSDPVELSRMELVNRHYVMTEVLDRRGVADFLRLALLESFHVAAAARGGHLRAVLRGKLAGVRELLVARHDAAVNR